MKRRGFPRRTFLRGAGSVAIALPFLEEMAPISAQPSSTSVPTRLVTAFFGLGLDPAWQEIFQGPLEPFQSLADKMAMFSVNVGQGSAGGAHCNTSTVVFVGEEQRSVNVAGGPSLDQRLRQEIDHCGTGSNIRVMVEARRVRRAGESRLQRRRLAPRADQATPPRSLIECSARTCRQTPADNPIQDLEAQRRELRIRRSVLDAVVGQYQHLRGEASYLGAESRRKIDQHLTSIREVEMQLAPADSTIDTGDHALGGTVACDVPSAPTDPNIADYDRFTYGTGGAAPEIDWQDFQAVYRLHADLWTIALRCDLGRYGNLAWESAGGHTNFRGTFSARGQSTDFPGNSQHDSYFHGNQKQGCRALPASRDDQRCVLSRTARRRELYRSKRAYRTRQ